MNNIQRRKDFLLSW